MTRSSDLWQVFEDTARRCADRPAILHGERGTTFGELWSQARAAAASLQRMGVAAGDRVVVQSSPSATTAAAVLGTWATGGIVALLDHEEKPHRARAMVDSIGASVAVVDRGCESELDGSVEVVVGPQLVVGGRRDLLRPVAAADQAAPASIVFTSGSTGGPKGVAQSHGNLVHGCRAVTRALGYRDHDRIVCPVSWAFDYGFGQLLSTVVTGLTQIVPTPAGVFGLADAARRHRPTVVAAVPWLLSYLVAAGGLADGSAESSVRLVTTTGGAVSRRVVEAVRALLPAASLSLNYGLTEGYRTTSLNPQLLPEAAGTVGTPIPGVEVCVMRADGTAAGVGEIGEVVHRGGYICLGYWGRGEDTARVVRPDPLAPSGGSARQRALYTGDLGFVDQAGLLTITGRRDRQLKQLGVRISPEEVEAVLMASPLVTRAAVVGVPHPELGHALWAVVVPAGACEGLPEKLRRYCGDRLRAEMRPQGFVVVPELPLTATGKVAYADLERQLATAAARE